MTGRAPLEGNHHEVRRTPGFVTRLVSLTRHSPAAILSLIVLGTVLALALAAPVVAPRDPTRSNFSAFETAPNRDYWLGTDSAGRDVWSRVVWGSRNSLIVGFAAVLIAVAVGSVVGALSGYYRGILDGLLMRVTDAFLAFPSIVLLLMMASILGPSLLNVILIIGLFNWTLVARLVRGEFLSLRESEWVLAARAIGATDRRIIVRHLLVQVVNPVIVAATFGMAGAILTEAALSYLGLGVRPPAPSWGAMLSEAQSVHVLRSVWWAWLTPGIALFVVVLSISYIGELLRRATGPMNES